MDELRVILLLAGAAVLAVVYYFGRPRRPGRGQSQSARRRESARPGEPGDESDAAGAEGGWSAVRDREPPPETLKRELKRLGELISRDRGAPAKGAPGKQQPESRREPEAAPPEPEPDKIVVLYVRTRKQTAISGRQLIEAAEKAGLEFGDMDIYHRLDEAGRRESIFSMANMVAPGTLDRAQAPGFTTPGVALFLRLPGPLPALDAWDAMLATARRLAELLDADLLDDNHSTLNRQRIQQLREEMREHDRLATLEIRRS